MRSLKIDDEQNHSMWRRDVNPAAVKFWSLYKEMGDSVKTKVLTNRSIFHLAAEGMRHPSEHAIATVIGDKDMVKACYKLVLAISEARRNYLRVSVREYDEFKGAYLVRSMSNFGESREKTIQAINTKILPIGELMLYKDFKALAQLQLAISGLTYARAKLQESSTASVKVVRAVGADTVMEETLDGVVFWAQYIESYVNYLSALKSS